ncbi:MAG TPA: threonine synthase [Pyrinomonadaceae bacterium]
MTSTPQQLCIEPACGATFPLNDRLYVCPRCGGLLDVQPASPSTLDPDELKSRWTMRLSSFDARDRSGVWRYRELLPFHGDARIVSLLEGNTPLYDATRSANYCEMQTLTLKHQGLNPTGSFKDTGMTTAITQAVQLGATTVVCASTGNTAASLAAYAARAGLPCAILVPRGQVSHAKLAQSLDYGAEVIEIDGNFDDSMRVIRELAEDESIYLVNSINPFRIEGQKTVAVEMLHQRDWRVPDHVVVPGGNLGNSSALGKGFRELLELGVIDRLPRLSVVQAEGAAPFAQLFAIEKEDHFTGAAELVPVENPETLATAIKIGDPVSWKKALREVRTSGGRVITVNEQEIADAKAVIGRDGVGCEPASATTVAGIRQLVASKFIGRDDDVVAVLTGHVLKDTNYVIKYHEGELIVGEEHQLLTGAFRNPPARVKATKEAILEYLR